MNTYYVCLYISALGIIRAAGRKGVQLHRASGRVVMGVTSDNMYCSRSERHCVLLRHLFTPWTTGRWVATRTLHSSTPGRKANHFRLGLKLERWRCWQIRGPQNKDEREQRRRWRGAEQGPLRGLVRGTLIRNLSITDQFRYHQVKRLLRRYDGSAYNLSKGLLNTF